MEQINVTKTEVVALLRELANLSQLAGENKFKAISYNRAATTIENLDRSLTEVSLRSLRGIGPKIDAKIHDFLTTGTCRKLQQLRRAHGDLLGLLLIPGVGAATARKLNQEHGARTFEDVKRLVAEKKITQKRIIEGVVTGIETRIPLRQAQNMVQPVLERLRAHPTVQKCEACGSLRRQKETVGDFDIIVQTTDRFQLAVLLREMLGNVSDDGVTKLSGNIGDRHCDFRYATEDNYGAMLLYFTGSKEFNIHMRREAIKRSWRLNEFGLWQDEDTCLASATEEEIFAKLEMEYTPPERRL